MITINKQKLFSKFSHARKEILDILADPENELYKKADINTKDRLANFLSQTATESQGFSKLEENLYYTTPDRIRAVFKKYFKNVSPEGYTKNPQKLANYVYANRMGNGNVESGDGYNFRGKSLIQITGRENTEKFAASRGISVEAANQYLLTNKGAIDGAIWFWDKLNLNDLADTNNLTAITKKINGGLNGLEDRRAYLNFFKSIIT